MCFEVERSGQGRQSSLSDSLTFPKSEENWTFLWDAAHQAPYIYDFGLLGGVCMLKILFFTLYASLCQDILESLFCSSE